MIEPEYHSSYDSSVDYYSEMEEQAEKHQNEHMRKNADSRVLSIDDQIFMQLAIRA